MLISNVVETLLTETFQKGYELIKLLIADKFRDKEGAEAGEGSIQAIPVIDYVHYYIVNTKEQLLIVYNSI